MADQRREMSRRVVLRGAALTGVAAPVLAACGSDGGTGSESAAPESAGGATESPSAVESSPAAEAGPAKATVPTSDVPVGGGKILVDEKVVVTQPAEGEFMAFSAVCTHQGCTVQSVAEGKITCPCHGSQFSAEDGSVVTGPASTPLESFETTVEGDEVTVS